MTNKLWLFGSFIAIAVSLYYTIKYPDYKWIVLILIATSIIFGACYEKNRERREERGSQEPPSLPKVPEEFKFENEEFPVR